MYLESEIKKLGDVVKLDKDVFDKDPNSFDFFFITMSQLNFFGGKIQENWIKRWNFLASSKAPIFIWYSDPLIFLNDFRELAMKKKMKNWEDVSEIDHSRFHFIHCFKDEMIKKDYEQTLRNRKSLAIINPVTWSYFNLAVSYYDTLPLVPGHDGELCYVGNNRNCLRSRKLKKLVGNVKINLHGDFTQEKPMWVLKEKFQETKLADVTKDYGAQICIYDDKQLRYKMDCFRILWTVRLGMLPICEQGLMYDIPTRLHDLITYDYLTTEEIMEKPLDWKLGKIASYQAYLTEKLRDVSLAERVKELYSSLVVV